MNKPTLNFYSTYRRKGKKWLWTNTNLRMWLKFPYTHHGLKFHGNLAISPIRTPPVTAPLLTLHSFFLTVKIGLGSYGISLNSFFPGWNDCTAYNFNDSKHILISLEFSLIHTEPKLCIKEYENIYLMECSTMTLISTNTMTISCHCFIWW